MATIDTAKSFNPALVIVDMQEDFVPPHGSLAVAGGRDLVGAINQLLDLPFACKVATQDWHPSNHISFASNHPAPNNKPFESLATVKNPLNGDEVETVRLWPAHCIQDTFGAKLIPELKATKIDVIVKKGQDHRVEMFSAFRDTFTKPCVSESALLSVLENRSITHVYVCGLAEDFCVKYTAIHAAMEGFTTYIISGATLSVNQGPESRKNLWKELRSHGVSNIDLSGPEISRVRQ